MSPIPPANRLLNARRPLATVNQMTFRIFAYVSVYHIIGSSATIFKGRLRKTNEMGVLKLDGARPCALIYTVDRSQN